LDVRARVTAQLLKHGVRPTKQRVQIGTQVLCRPCHFSADQLLAGLRRSGVSISKATVYNTLNLFSRHGLIREIAVDPSRLLYDSTTRPHHHFFNVATGELTDIEPDDLRLPRLPQLPQSTVAESVEIIIRVRDEERD
jgi:Fur family iron response transcriptional regulator